MVKGRLIAVGRFVMRIPDWLWRRVSSRRTSAGQHSPLAFMTPEHNRVRDCVVLELPRRGVPFTPEHISQAVGLALPRVVDILDDLERHLTFLYRDRDGAVAWAYPVTVEHTPHRITLNGKERLYAA